MGHVPGPSNYPTNTTRISQAHLGNTSVAAASRRSTLQRQHRSMDGLGLLESIVDPAMNDYRQDRAVPSYVPLAVSTQQYGGSNDYHRTAAPLSNPISTHTASFWNNHQPYSMSGNAHYDIEASSSRLPGGMSLAVEFDQLKLDYNSAIEKLNQTMNSIKTFWSPELKRERQLRREEATRLAQLENILNCGGGGYSADGAQLTQLRMELANREERIRQLSSILEDSGANGLYGNDNRFQIENALRRVDEKQARIVQLEEELLRMKHSSSNKPRDFTEKNLSGHEMVTMRMKLDRSEIELADRKSELVQCQTRMQTAEETASEVRGHLQLLKDQLTNREQHNTLLQGDVDALRQKLDNKNSLLEQKEERILCLEKELATGKADFSDKNEQVRQFEMRITQLVGRIDSLETGLREKEQELDKAKVRLLAHPDVVREKEMLEKIEHGERERIRLQEHIDQLRANGEKERLEQQKSYQGELRTLHANIENLQKELSDRDILLESQNEKIGDMGRELNAARKKLDDAMVDKGADELRKEVEGARTEVDKLLKMVHQLEKENAGLQSANKQLNTDKRDADQKNQSSTMYTNTAPVTSQQANMKKRIEELEEALRESVAITAEREVHLTQQKQILGQMSHQLADARREVADMRQKTLPSSENAEREQFMRSIEAERRQHLEQLLQLKQEALLAAIGEKDAHLALLEKARGPREEIETIRRHKEALMRKLKQENERRSLVLRPDSAGATLLHHSGANVIPGAQMPPMLPALPTNTNHNSNHDDTEGIWA